MIPAWRDSKIVGFLFIAALLGVWELLATQVFAFISFPPVSSVLWRWGRFLGSFEVVEVLVPSLSRLAMGYVLAVALAVGVGLLMGYFRFAFNLLEPLVEFLRPIPTPALIPIAILFLGIENRMKVFIIVFAAFWPILLNTYSGVRNVDPVFINTGRTFGLNRREILVQIVLPAASPYIVTGMRVSLAIALILVVIAEMVAGNDGIGYYILDTQRTFRVREMYAGVLTLALLGYLLNRLFLAVESRVMAWNIEATRRAP